MLYLSIYAFRTHFPLSPAYIPSAFHSPSISVLPLSMPALLRTPAHPDVAPAGHRPPQSLMGSLPCPSFTSHFAFACAPTKDGWYFKVTRICKGTFHTTCCKSSFS